MTTRVVILLSVIVALAVTTPTTAQDEGEEHLVDLVYELTIEGGRPASDSFMVRFTPCDAYDNCGAGGWPICPGVHAECSPTGRASFAYKPGTRVEYEFVRAEGGHREVFKRGVVSLTSDTTARAQFSYRNVGGQQGKEDSVPEKLPNTGAGGIAR